MEITLKNGHSFDVGVKYAMGFYLNLFDRGLPSRESLTEQLQEIKVDLKLTHTYLFYIYNTNYNLIDMAIPFKDWFESTKGLREKSENLDINISVALMFFQVLYETQQNTKKEVVIRGRREFGLVNKSWHEMLIRYTQQPERYTNNNEYLKLEDPLGFYRHIACDFEEESEYINIDKYIEEFELDVDYDKFINGMDDHCIIMKRSDGLVWNCPYIKEMFYKLDYTRILWARMNRKISRTKIRRFHYAR